MNGLFEKIFVITSYDTHERLKELLPNLNKHSIKYEIVVSPKKKYFKEHIGETWIGNGAASLISGTESIFLKSLIDRYDNICILEDDLFFNENINIQNLPNNWDIINFGYHYHSKINNETRDIFSKITTDDFIIGTHIVAYKKNTFEIIIDELNSINNPLDLFLNNKIYHTFNSFIFKKQLFYASSYRHYEDDKSFFYKKYKSSIN
jgi:hypothetical protein